MDGRLANIAMGYNDGSIGAMVQSPRLAGVTIEEYKEKEEQYRREQEQRINTALRAGVIELVLNTMSIEDIPKAIDHAELIIDYIKNGPNKVE